MLSDFSWNTFKQTGDINAYFLYKDIERTRTSDNEGSGNDISQSEGNSDRR